MCSQAGVAPSIRAAPRRITDQFSKEFGPMRWAHEKLNPRRGSTLLAPARSASSKPGSQRTESTRGSPQFPKQPACSGWCQAWPQVAAGSASQAHQQPGPQASRARSASSN
eukprot:903513-Pyramimonas_sp.AAC.1